MHFELGRGLQREHQLPHGQVRREVEQEEDAQDVHEPGGAARGKEPEARARQDHRHRADQLLAAVRHDLMTTGRCARDVKLMIWKTCIV